MFPLSRSPANGTPTGDTPKPSAAEAIPEPRTDSSAQATAEESGKEKGSVRKLPYDQPGALAALLDKKLENDTFFELLQFLNERGLKRDPARLVELAQSFAAQTAAQADSPSL